MLSARSLNCAENGVNSNGKNDARKREDTMRIAVPHNTHNVLWETAAQEFVGKDLSSLRMFPEEFR